MPIDVTQPSITLFFPFDLGRSFVFTRNREQPARWGEQWEWTLDYFEWDPNVPLLTDFKLPTGLAAQRKLTTAESHVFKTAVAGVRCIWRPETHPEAVVICFTTGVGCLVVRGNLAAGPRPRPEALREWSRQATEWFTPVAALITRSFLLALRNDVKRLSEVNEVHRERSDPLLSYVYGVIFHSDPLPDEGPQAKLASLDGRAMIVGWADVDAPLCPLALHEELEGLVLAGLCGWTILSAMDGVVNRTAFEILRDHSRRRRIRIRSGKARTIRFAYMAAAQAYRPLNWTMTGRKLHVLKTLHEVWETEELYGAVESQTELLSLHCEQLDTDRREIVGMCLAGFGAVIAVFSTVSAVTDFVAILDRKPEAGHYPSFEHALYLAGATPASVLFALVMIGIGVSWLRKS